MFVARINDDVGSDHVSNDHVGNDNSGPCSHAANVSFPPSARLDCA
jgi:hypothetical protein